MLLNWPRRLIPFAGSRSSENFRERAGQLRGGINAGRDWGAIDEHALEHVILVQEHLAGHEEDAIGVMDVVEGFQSAAGFNGKVICAQRICRAAEERAADNVPLAGECVTRIVNDQVIEIIGIWGRVANGAGAGQLCVDSNRAGRRARQERHELEPVEVGFSIWRRIRDAAVVAVSSERVGHCTRR